MARLNNPPKEGLRHTVPDKDKRRLALQWLREHPNEPSTAAARIYHIENEDSLRKAWGQEREKDQRITPIQNGGQNKILRPDQHAAMIQYSLDQATNGGKRATKQMIYNCTMWLRAQESRSIPL
jgi:hypothetical protein